MKVLVDTCVWSAVLRRRSPDPELSVKMKDLIETEHFEKAAEFFNICRKAGVQGSSIDFLICSVAAKENWPIFTTGRDFDKYRRHLPIRIV